MRSRARRGRSRTTRSGARRTDRAGADLVEAGAAVHRPVVPRCERNNRLTAAASADRGVELTRAADGPSSLCDRSARRAPLRIIQQAFAREEGLLAAREDEFTRAVTAGEGPILEHACLFL